MKKFLLSIFLLTFAFVSVCFADMPKSVKLGESLHTNVNGAKLKVQCDSIKIPQKFSEFEDSSAEVADLASNIPSMNEATQSFIWRKDTKVNVNKDNSLDVTRKVIAYIGESVPECYKFICIPVAKGTTLQLLDAKIYDSQRGTAISPLIASPVNLEGGGFALMLSVTDEAIGRVIVISYLEHYAPNEHLSFYTEFADRQFSIWDQSLTVKTPKDIELHFDGLNADNPSKVEDADSTTYLWHNTNQLAAIGNPFVEQHLPFIAFSNKLGAVNGITSLNKLFDELYSNVKIPEDFKTIDLRAMLGIIDDKNNTLPGDIQTSVRDAEVVPTKGPWTTWEKVAIVSSYAKQLGAKVQFTYMARQDMNDKSSSATRELFYIPVMKIIEKSGRVSYFVPDNTGCFDKYSPLVAGKTVYFESNGKLKKKTLKSLSSAFNHLDFTWNLKLDENGTSTGTLNVDYAGTWQNLLANGVKPTKENIDDFVKNAFTLPIPGLQLKCTNISQTGPNKTRLNFDVKCQEAIVQGNRLLFRIPGGIPNALLAFNPTQKNYNFKFPFSITQMANVSFPVGYTVIQNPSLTNTPPESSAFVIKQEFDYKSQWHRLEIGSKLVVRLNEVTAEQAQFVGQQLAAVCHWPMTDVGFIRSEKVQLRQEKIMKEKFEKKTQEVKSQLQKNNSEKNDPKKLPQKEK
ncbi:MAG: hypothetical protein Q4C78_02470 [Synergistaceae bacterium]|nr:hypothetical protein [Synergistaceae bacterium]